MAATSAVAQQTEVQQTGPQTLSLSQAECRSMALTYSEDLQRADNAVRQAELEKAAAFTNYLPKVDGSVMLEYMTDMDMAGATLQMRGMYLAGLTLTQPIYVGGKIRNGNKLAEIGKECSEEQRAIARMQVVADADKAYWTYIAVLWKVKMLEAYKQQMDTLYGQTKLSVNSGMATNSSLLRIDAKRNDIEYQLQKAKNGANLCRLSLCNVIGCPLDREITPTDTVITLAEPGDLDGSIESRPELRLLQKQVEAAELQVKTTRADFLPQVALSAGYTYYGNVKIVGQTADAQGNPMSYSQEYSDGIGLAILSVNIPIFHWGEGVKKVKKSKLEIKNMQLEQQENARLMNIEVQQAIQNVQDSHALARTAELGCRQAEESLREMQNRYQCGMCSLIDLMDAQSQWQQAESNNIEAQTQCKISETEYLRVTGQITD